MKPVSKFFRYSFVLLLALIVAFSAAIGVAADNFACPARMFQCKNFNAAGSTGTLDFIDGNGEANPSVTPTSGYHLGVEIQNQFQNNTSYVFVITINGNTNDIWYSDYYNILQLHSGGVVALYNTNDTNNYFDKATFQNTGLQDGTISYIITFNTNGDDLAYTYDHLYFAWVTQLTGTSNYIYKFQSITAYATYDPDGATLNDIRQEIQNIINSNTTNNTTINNKLDQVISNQTSSNQSIEQALSDIITNQETQNQYWEQIINYGDTYDQVNNTLINNLGSAENQLSSAEDALQNKSKSLIQRAASGIATAKTASQTLVSALSTTVPQIVSSTTDLVETAPEEVQAAVLSIPLLSFAAWLIGLKK